MYLLYCDESNLEARAADFFVYGGLAVPGEHAAILSAAVENLRRDFGIGSEYALKFNPGPAGMSHEAFIDLKRGVIAAAVDANCVFLTSLILHDVATSPDDARRNEINRIAYHFDCYLQRPDSHGIVLLDRFDDKQIDAHLREKFSVGITGLPYTERHRLERILGFHYSAIGQSHFGSVVDVILGSFRFAVNAFTRNQEHFLPTARTILNSLAPLFLVEETSGRVSPLSLNWSPRVVRVRRFREAYHRLSSFLDSCGIRARDEVTEQRQY